MDDASLIEKFTEFGLTRLESTIYLCLLRFGMQNGYEVAKETGISRSNVYSALSSLVEKGAAWVEEGNPTRYISVPVKEFCDNRIRLLKDVSNELLLFSPKEETNLSGYASLNNARVIFDKVRHLLLECKQRVYFSSDFSYLKNFEEELFVLLKEGRKVVLLANDFDEDFYNCSFPNLTLIRFGKKGEWVGNSIPVRVIIDSTMALSAELNNDKDGQGIFSSQLNFVRVLKDALSAEMQIGSIIKE